MASLIYHLVRFADLKSNLQANHYVAPSLQSEGFIHCTAGQRAAVAVANDYFDLLADPVVVVELNAGNLKSTVKFEAAVPIAGGGRAHLKMTECWPHIYGPLYLEEMLRCAMMEVEHQRFVFPQVQCWIPVGELLNSIEG